MQLFIMVTFPQGNPPVCTAQEAVPWNKHTQQTDKDHLAAERLHAGVGHLRAAVAAGDTCTAQSC